LRFLYLLAVYLATPTELHCEHAQIAFRAGKHVLSEKPMAVRLDEATIARLDALLPLYALPGRAATRSDGLRAVILAGLEIEERRVTRHRPGPGGGGKPSP